MRSGPAPICGSSEGDVGAGDAIDLVSKPDHDLTVRDVFRIYTRERDESGRIVDVPQMSAAWKRWARETFEHKAGAKHAPGCC